MSEDTFITIDCEDVLSSELVFDFIDRMVNYQYKRIAIYISDPTKQKEIEDWLIETHHPMLNYITVKSVIVTNSPPKSQAYISSRAIRFTNWADIERYFI
jgi:hypothetical protein